MISRRPVLSSRVIISLVISVLAYSFTAQALMQRHTQQTNYQKCPFESGRGLHFLCPRSVMAACWEIMFSVNCVQHRSSAPTSLDVSSFGRALVYGTRSSWFKSSTSIQGRGQRDTERISVYFRWPLPLNLE